MSPSKHHRTSNSGRILVEEGVQEETGEAGSGGGGGGATAEAGGLGPSLTGMLGGTSGAIDFGR